MVCLQGDFLKKFVPDMAKRREAINNMLIVLAGLWLEEALNKR
jgi:hypothetical protein